jgi:hypothetical protein
MIRNPITTILASVIPDSANARRAGGILLAIPMAATLSG